MSERPLLTGREVAIRLAISRSAVYRLMQAGMLPCVRIGRSVRVRAEDLERFVTERMARSYGRDIGS